MTGGRTIKANSAGPRRTSSISVRTDRRMEQRQFMSRRPEGELGPRRPIPASAMEQLADPVDRGDRPTHPRTQAREVRGIHRADILGEDSSRCPGITIGGSDPRRPTRLVCPRASSSRHRLYPSRIPIRDNPRLHLEIFNPRRRSPENHASTDAQTGGFRHSKSASIGRDFVQAQHSNHAAKDGEKRSVYELIWQGQESAAHFPQFPPNDSTNSPNSSRTPQAPFVVAMDCKSTKLRAGASSRRHRHPEFTMIYTGAARDSEAW